MWKYWRLYLFNKFQRNENRSIVQQSLLNISPHKEQPINNDEVLSEECGNKTEEKYKELIEQIQEEKEKYNVLVARINELENMNAQVQCFFSWFPINDIGGCNRQQLQQRLTSPIPRG